MGQHQQTCYPWVLYIPSLDSKCCHNKNSKFTSCIVNTDLSNIFEIISFEEWMTIFPSTGIIIIDLIFKTKKEYTDHFIKWVTGQSCVMTGALN